MTPYQQQVLLNSTMGQQAIADALADADAEAAALQAQMNGVIENRDFQMQALEQEEAPLRTLMASAHTARDAADAEVQDVSKKMADVSARKAAAVADYNRASGIVRDNLAAAAQKRAMIQGQQ